MTLSTGATVCQAKLTGFLDDGILSAPAKPNHRAATKLCGASLGRSTPA